MTTLSTPFNWHTLEFPSSETNTFHEEVAAPNLQNLFPYSDESFYLSNPIFENYIDPSHFLYPSEVYPPYDPFVPFTYHDIFPTHEDHTVFSHVQKAKSAAMIIRAPCKERKCNKKFSMRFHNLSIAARERRKKISEKTQELGKLVPGGPKMNTADMLHAAAKYVKYLQAQVGMLELMISFEKDKATPPYEILHNLIVSPLVEEKLYTGEMCFALKEIVTTLTNHEDVQSRPTIAEDLDLKQLIGTDIEEKAKQE
ncbi:transcription factor bHLH53 [Cajanus cajan]|uniref:transcription factor bHLH53 n=1 Tax=Cajanus cajan TaxID=3821 RepID=UPI00098DA122|nr:transcription factor bHLH53 [Cajanus cajan]XP_020239915.1 transcription factor bHLH53 [Cajanus cajan]XP_020239916.1 transcription factor bHLH53 [Cajanus cajan]